MMMKGIYQIYVLQRLSKSDALLSPIAVGAARQQKIK
jgi:hypothetical protein